MGTWPLWISGAAGALLIPFVEDAKARSMILVLLSGGGCLTALEHLELGGSLLAWEPVALGCACYAAWEIRRITGGSKARVEARTRSGEKGFGELFFRDPRLESWRRKP